MIVVGISNVYAWVSYLFGNSALTLTFVYVVLVLPYSYRALDAALSSINVVTLAEAARSLGAGWGTVIVRVILPNISRGVHVGGLRDRRPGAGRVHLHLAAELPRRCPTSSPRSARPTRPSRSRRPLAALIFATLLLLLFSLLGAAPFRERGLTDHRTRGILDRRRRLARRPASHLRQPATPSTGSSLEMAPGEMVVLLGPSGCGKTTALRILAGLDRADDGAGAGRRQGHHPACPANKRDMGMVFQAYSLFPHMTVRDNVAFGLRLRGQDTGQRLQRARDMLELVGLAEFADRYAHQLSGGQQQRVALARALAIEPAVLLLDEPLSALDAKVRVQLRDEIRRVQLEVGTTTLFVTHDQEEALAVADRVGVMNAGRLDQIAPPTELYARPATRFVAEFVGLSNRLPADVSGGGADPARHPRRRCSTARSSPGAGQALVRPESLASRRPTASSQRPGGLGGVPRPVLPGPVPPATTVSS